MAARKKTHGDPIVFGLNLNGILTSVLGGLATLVAGVSVYLINTNLQEERLAHDLLQKHSWQIESIIKEQARIKKDYAPPVTHE
jgi:hypothetical protein